MTGTTDSGSKIKQVAHQEDNVKKLKGICNKAFAFLKQENPVSQDLKLKLSTILRELNDPTRNPTAEDLDLIKNKINCILQLAIPRKPASSLLHRQLPSDTVPALKLLQPQSQTPHVMLCEDHNTSQMQLMNEHGSALALQQNNVEYLQDSRVPRLVTSMTMKSQQQSTKSYKDQGISLQSVQQPSMGSSQTPASSPQCTNIGNILSSNAVKSYCTNSNQYKIDDHAPARELKEIFHKQQRQKHVKPAVPQQKKQQKCAHQIPQGIGYRKPPLGMNKVKNSKAGEEISQVLHHNSATHHQHLKYQVSPPISSGRLCQSESIQTSQISAQTNHRNLLGSREGRFPNQSLNLPSIVPSPLLEPTPKPNASSTLNTSNVGEHKTDTMQPIKRFDISALLAPTPKQNASSTIMTGNVGEHKTDTGQPVREFDTNSNASVIPIAQSVAKLEKEDKIDCNAPTVNLMSSKALNAAVSDIGAVLSLSDCIQAEVSYVTVGEAHPAARKLKRSIISAHVNERTSAAMETSDFGTTMNPRVKRARIEVNCSLLKEIQEINKRLVDTESPIEPLQLLVPTNYPSCPPIFLEKLPEDISEEHGNLSGKAKVKLNKSLRSLEQPMSLAEIARAWDSCARAVISEYALQNGGGNVFSKYGTWESCLTTN
ncbi:hypothetical protein Tsubulata_004537 [Turnera subulata]|uniref:ARC105/Med15 mediator subunit C-terminal domain-containing protein n=1 Tax=Turnera subulata TaxID=218843 RepID=A0A9Q0JD44_9ROSI|nr:hypothetical protein Tsubulata_004537 [Turnera subulata]